jgi:hypothetical protein
MSFYTLFYVEVHWHGFLSAKNPGFEVDTQFIAQTYLATFAKPELKQFLAYCRMAFRVGFTTFTNTPEKAEELAQKYAQNVERCIETLNPFGSSLAALETQTALSWTTVVE